MPAACLCLRSDLWYILNVTKSHVTKSPFAAIVVWRQGRCVMIFLNTILLRPTSPFASTNSNSCYHTRA